MGEIVGFEDAHHDAVEGVAMGGTEEVAALRALRTGRPTRGAVRMNEAGAKRHGDWWHD